MFKSFFYRYLQPLGQELAKLVPLALGAILGAFLVATVWAMTVTGLFEQASIDVDHLDAGAGNNLLLLRFFLALAASVIAILWSLLGGAVAVRLARLAVAPSVFLIFAWSVVSLDRFAPGFSEKEFLSILEAHHAGKLLTTTDVAAKLGSPLMTAARPDGHTIWSYTYTPSGGFGWHKRILTFDSRGALVYASRSTEP